MHRVLILLVASGCANSQQRNATESSAAMTSAPARPAAPPVVAADEPSVYAALDAVGKLENVDYDPGPVIVAINLLQSMGREKGTAALAAYFKARGPKVNERGGLFAVLRVLYEPPAARPPFPKDACTPRQREWVAGPCLRPPMLGAPKPAPPEDLLSLRYPLFVLGDVPLSLVSGYDLGGKAESVSMHFGGLSGAPTGWLKAPLKPSSAGEIRYLFVHDGQWSWTDDVGKGVERQLQRLK